MARPHPIEARRRRPSVTGVLLAVAALGACARQTTPSPSTEPAGSVVRLVGQATAERPGSAVRALAIGGPVFADDTLVTAPAASLTIELLHNRARWDLEGDQRRRVDTSIAWRAPRQAGDGDRTAAIGTTAAGRHAEREAAEGASTVVPNQGLAAAPASAPPASPPKAAASTSADPAPAERATPRELAQAEEGKMGLIGAESAEGRGGLGVAAGISAGVGGEGAPGPGGGGTGSGSDAGRGGSGVGNIGGVGSAGPAGKRARVAQRVEATGGLATAALRRAISPHRDAIEQCLAQATGRVILVVRIAVDGVPGAITATTEGDAAAASSCLRERAARWRFPPSATETTMTLTVGG